MAEGEAALPIGLNGFNLVLRNCCLLLFRIAVVPTWFSFFFFCLCTRRWLVFVFAGVCAL
jgi:hypothetical protein